MKLESDWKTDVNAFKMQRRKIKCIPFKRHKERKYRMERPKSPLLNVQKETTKECKKINIGNKYPKIDSKMKPQTLETQCLPSREIYKA